MIKEWDSAFINFSPEELACPKTGGYKFHPEFPERMQQLRSMYNKPMFITSCCRSEEHNNSLNKSSPNSLHIFDKPKRGALGTCAFDTRISDSVDRHEFLKIALALGFSCYFIGGNPQFIHCDQRILLGEQARFW